MLRNTSKSKAHTSSSISGASSLYTAQPYQHHQEENHLDTMRLLMLMPLVIIVLLFGSFIAVLSENSVSSPFAAESMKVTRSLDGEGIGRGGSGLRLSRSPEAHQMKKAAIMPLMADKVAADDMGTEGTGVGVGGAVVEHSGNTIGSNFLADLEKNVQKIKDGSVTAERMLVHSGDMSLASHEGKADDLANKIVHLVEGEGKGYVESRSSRSGHGHSPSWSDRRDTKSIRLQLRVASTKFHDIVSKIRQMVEKKSHVISFSTNSRDVTDEYIDSKARADTLEASRNSVKMILSSANSIKDVMTVKDELNRLTEQIESHRKRAMYLQKQASLSSLSVTIDEEANKEQNQKPSTLMWDPFKPLGLASRHLAYLLGVLGDTLVYATVWAFPCTFCWVLIRTFRRNLATHSS